jgi:hypothetical protein
MVIFTECQTNKCGSAAAAAPARFPETRGLRGASEVCWQKSIIMLKNLLDFLYFV